MLTVQIDNMENFTAMQEAKLLSSITVLERVVNSDDFRAMLNNEDVYSKIMSGSEVLTPYPDEKINLDITLYYSRWSKVIGYTYPNTPKTWINLKYFNRFSYAQIAGNIAHENLGHKCGYGEVEAYKIGNIVAKLGETL